MNELTEKYRKSIGTGKVKGKHKSKQIDTNGAFYEKVLALRETPRKAQ